MIKWTEQNSALIKSAGHALVLGGPGSGKTTMALLKAGDETINGTLKGGQRILFLSFARATISRIEQHAKGILTAEKRGQLEINTYHGFAWNLIRSHGYLLFGHRVLRLLPPPQAASILATTKGAEAKEAEKHRMLNEEGVLHFDLFAHCASELVERSKNLRTLISDVYPIIVLDEFQDTNPDEWRLIQQLGKVSRLIALADPEQRIYEFRGASPTRIPEFIKVFNPDPFDFSTANYRSAGTDICAFGNDLLKGANKGKAYGQVAVRGYQFRKGNGAHWDLKATVLARRKTLIDSGASDWSIAVLVPTKHLMLEVSEYLDDSQPFNSGKRAPRIDHEVAIEAAGPSLAAQVIAGVLSGGSSSTEVAQLLLRDLCNHMKGRKGADTPNQQQLQLAEALGSFLDTGVIRGARRKAIADECKRIGDIRIAAHLSGDPENDWLMVRQWFLDSAVPELQAIGQDAKFLKFLHKGSVLRSKLAEVWRSTAGYAGASRAVYDSLLQEHFSSSSKSMRGIYVMNIHKAKGKEFDEVIIYEGATPFKDRFLRPNAAERDRAQALLSLRVGVTRAMKFTTILTPKHDPCPFF